jgi:hypothetical protein
MAQARDPDSDSGSAKARPLRVDSCVRSGPRTQDPSRAGPFSGSEPVFRGFESDRIRILNPSTRGGGLRSRTRTPPDRPQAQPLRRRCRAGSRLPAGGRGGKVTRRRASAGPLAQPVTPAVAGKAATAYGRPTAGQFDGLRQAHSTAHGRPTRRPTAGPPDGLRQAYSTTYGRGRGCSYPPRVSRDSRLGQPCSVLTGMERGGSPRRGALLCGILHHSSSGFHRPSLAINMDMYA